jgi:hypothetical protein
MALGASGALALAVLGTSGNASAQTATTQATTVEQTTQPPPNRYVMSAGIGMFALSYVPGIFVAIQSDRDSDKRLYIPVVGPWLSLGQRDCDAQPCTNNWLSVALLIADGVAQGLGALAVISSFFIPEGSTTVEKTTTTGKRESEKKIVVTPAQIGRDGYGLAAFGRF